LRQQHLVDIFALNKTPSTLLPSEGFPTGKTVPLSVRRGRQNARGAETLISPREHQVNYQRALAWVGEQITEAERRGLTLDYLGGWHRYKPD